MSTVLHILANSPPDINGYAIRTQMILQHQNELPSTVVFGLTSPWYPQRESMIEEYKTKTIHYYRTVHPLHKKEKIPFTHRIIRSQTRKELSHKKNVQNANRNNQQNFFVKYLRRAIRAPGYFLKIGWKVAEEKVLIKYFTKRIIEIAKQTKAEIIHAHTPYRVGLPALKAARKLNLPFVYEMRGMWEETAVANGRWLRNGPAYRRFQNYETKVLRKADSVICISETLKKEAIRRGVAIEKIIVVSNAVEKNMLENRTTPPSYQSIKKSLNLINSTKVIGYIGSLRNMEGVDFTAEAVSKLNDKGYDVRFFVLTGKDGQDELRSLCKRLGIEDKVIIIGPVPHEEVAAFYDLIDIFIVSRPDSRVTQLVTPLKPFEAMVMGKAVIASKLPALEGIIKHQETGLLYPPGNLDSLVESIERCIENDNLRKSLGDSAREWILENRTWDIVVKNTLRAYEIAKIGR